MRKAGFNVWREEGECKIVPIVSHLFCRCHDCFSLLARANEAIKSVNDNLANNVAWYERKRYR